MRNCLHCGDPLPKDAHHNRKYHEECYNGYRRSLRGVRRIGACQHCGDPLPKDAHPNRKCHEECVAEYKRLQRRAYDDRRKEAKAKYYQDNKDTILERNAKYYQENIDRLRRRARERARVRYRENPDKFLEAQRKYREKTTRDRRWNKDNKDRLNARRRERYANDPDYRKARRESTKKRTTFNRTELVQTLYEKAWGICNWCGDELPMTTDGRLVHVDHIQPVSRGGTNDVENLQLLHASCNIQKSDKVA